MLNKKTHPKDNYENLSYLRLLRNLAAGIQKFKGEYVLLVGFDLDKAHLPARLKTISDLKIKVLNELKSDSQEFDSSDDDDQIFKKLEWFESSEFEYAESLYRAFTSDFERRQYLTHIYEGQPDKVHLLLANIIKNEHIKDIFQLSGDRMIIGGLDLLGCTDYRQIPYDIIEDYPRFIGKSINIVNLHDCFTTVKFEYFSSLSDGVANTLYTLFKQEYSEYGLIILGYDGIDRAIMKPIIKACQEFHFSKGIFWIIEKSELSSLEQRSFFRELLDIGSTNLNIIIVDSYESAIDLIHTNLSLKIDELGWDENWSGIEHHKQNLVAFIEQYRLAHSLSSTKVSVRLNEFQSAEMGTNKQYDVYTAVARYNQILVLGDAGSGKTTLLHDLCLDCIRNDHDKIPLLIRLRDFNGDVLEMIKSSFLGQIDLTTLRAGLRRGRFLLLFDGLNEVHEVYDAVIREINSLTSKKGHPRNQYIVTSRGYRLESELLGFKAFTVSPLSSNIIQNFLSAELGPSSKVSVTKLMETSIYSICSNVMILLLLAQSYQKTGKFPENQSALYNQFVLTFIERYSAEFDTNLKLEILLHIAQKMDQLVIVDYLIIKKSVAQYLANDSEFDATSLENSVYAIEELCHDGVLVKRADSLEFFHQSVQDYLRAEYLAKEWNINNKAVILNVARDARNYEVLIFLSGILDNSDLLIQSLVEINIYLAVRCVGSAREVNSTVVDIVIDNLVQLFKGEYSARSVFEALAYLGERSIIPSAKYLKDNRAEFRHFVDYLIKLLEPSKALDSLHRMIRSQTDDHVRLHLAEALSQIQTLDNVSRMVELLSIIDDKELIIKALILNSLLITRTKLGEDTMKRQLPSESWLQYFTSENAERDLDKMTDRLMDIARSSEKYFYRAHACATLGDIGNRKAITTLANALLHDEKWNVRFRSAKALGIMGDKRAIFPLTEALRSDEDNWVRGHAADALGKVGDDAILPELNKALEDKSEFVRATARDAIEQIKSKPKAQADFSNV